MENYKPTDVRFADIQMLRYRLDGLSQLSLRQKQLIFFLSQATLWGRDITFDQFGRYNLKIRKLLEAIFVGYQGDKTDPQFAALHDYLRRVWFSSGIHHHYGGEKFIPEFTAEFLAEALHQVPADTLPLEKGQTVEQLLDELRDPLFNPEYMPKRVNTADGIDQLLGSACNFYQGVTQKEAEEYYALQSSADGDSPVFHGLNTTLRKAPDGTLHEDVWYAGGKYGKAIQHIVYWLRKAIAVAENPGQKKYMESLVEYYQTGSLETFNRYCIEWVGETSANIDFVNGFIEVYGDPMGLKGSWEGIVEYRDEEATRRTRTISDNAQWFEDRSPVDTRFRKPHVSGVVANVVRAAMLGGDEYPSTAIGINLPNADWIRARHGSKSVTISNLISAYNEAARGNGFKEEFINDEAVIKAIDKYGDLCDDLHTDLHECLGHGSGRLLDGVSPDALKSYGSTIEEARADLFGLYFIADPKLVELGLLPDGEAYKASYYSYILNGMLTQLVRIKPGNKIEEAHMRNRALISRWCYSQGSKQHVIEMYDEGGKTFIRINDYSALRQLFARLLAEIQRIKSEGDYGAARNLVEEYAININPELHAQLLQRYAALNLAPYKGFINPVLTPVYGADGQIADVRVDYSEGYDEQMLRYGREYSPE